MPGFLVRPSYEMGRGRPVAMVRNRRLITAIRLNVRPAKAKTEATNLLLSPRHWLQQLVSGLVLVLHQYSWQAATTSRVALAGTCPLLSRNEIVEKGGRRRRRTRRPRRPKRSRRREAMAPTDVMAKITIRVSPLRAVLVLVLVFKPVLDRFRPSSSQSRLQKSSSAMLEQTWLVRCGKSRDASPASARDPTRYNENR